MDLNVIIDDKINKQSLTDIAKFIQLNIEVRALKESQHKEFSRLKADFLKEKEQMIEELFPRIKEVNNWFYHEIKKLQS